MKSNKSQKSEKSVPEPKPKKKEPIKSQKSNGLILESFQRDLDSSISEDEPENKKGYLILAEENSFIKEHEEFVSQKPKKRQNSKKGDSQKQS